MTMEAETQLLREELKLGREKYDALMETNKHLEFSMKSSKHQFEREIMELQMAHKNEVLALNEGMESTMKTMHFHHERELTQLRTQHKQEMESVDQINRDCVKSKVSELTKKNLILQATIKDGDVKIDRLRRQVYLAILKIRRLNGLVLTYKASDCISQPSNTPSKSKVEEVSIAAKIMDPDEEALAAGILLSSQHARYGTNMFDSLTEDDNAVIDEYITQGCTRYMK